MVLARSDERETMVSLKNLAAPQTPCKDVEGFQRRCAGLVSHLRDKPYPHRLRHLRIPTLERCRNRGLDFIDVYKYISGSYEVKNRLFTMATYSQAPGNREKKKKTLKKSEVVFFAQRELWQTGTATLMMWSQYPTSAASRPALTPVGRSSHPFLN